MTPRPSAASGRLNLLPLLLGPLLAAAPASAGQAAVRTAPSAVPALVLPAGSVGHSVPVLLGGVSLPTSELLSPQALLRGVEGTGPVSPAAFGARSFLYRTQEGPALAPAAPRPFAGRRHAAPRLEDALGAARAVAEAAAPRAAAAPSESEVRRVSATVFDGDASLDGPGVPTDGGGTGRGGNGDGDGGPSAPSGGSPLNHFYPRAVFLQDVFQAPASEKTVEYLEKLLDAGVHLVFLTWRPQKGPGSAEEVLLSRLKYRRENPVVVVSFNGAKISLHGRAQNPRSILDDVGGIPLAGIESLRGMKAKVEKTLRLPPGALEEEVLPSIESPFSYIVELPETIRDADLPAARGRAIRRFNQLMKASGLPYTMAPHSENPRAILAQSMPLRVSLPRVYKALDEQFHAEKLNVKPEKFLFLADSRRSPRYSSSFPKKAEVQVVRSGADVEEVLGAVLGDRRLPTVSIRLGKLRQFIEYWEPSRRFRLDGESSGGGGGARRGGPKGDRETHQKFAMYTGTVIYQLMAYWYEQVFKGQHHQVSLPVLQARLRNMWYNPLRYGVYVNKPLAKAMQGKAWKAMSRHYLDYANAYLVNYYLREFATHTEAARNVEMNLVGLSTDRKSLITLEFASASTHKLYKIHTRIPRVMKLDTAQGRVLTAHSYRSGKETPDDGEEFLAQILAMALLKGHGRKGPDGLWHHGATDGPVIAKLRVQLEYRSSHRTWEFDPEEFLRLEEGQVVQGPIAQEITSAIEREEADEDYQKYYEEQEAQATKADLKKKKARKKPASRAAKAKAKTKTKRRR